MAKENKTLLEFLNEIEKTGSDASSWSILYVEPAPNRSMAVKAFDNCDDDDEWMLAVVLGLQYLAVNRPDIVSAAYIQACAELGDEEDDTELPEWANFSKGEPN